MAGRMQNKQTAIINPNARKPELITAFLTVRLSGGLAGGFGGGGGEGVLYGVVIALDDSIQNRCNEVRFDQCSEGESLRWATCPKGLGSR